MDTGAACYKRIIILWGSNSRSGRSTGERSAGTLGYRKVVYAGMERASVRTDELYLSIFTGRADEIEIYSLRTEKENLRRRTDA